MPFVILLNRNMNILIQQKIGQLDSFNVNSKTIDWLALEWYETNKRIQHKQTFSGKEVTIKFLNENPNFTQGDILYEDETSLIVIKVLECEAIVIQPKDMFEVASVCYEIGNKHLPLFYENDLLLVPFEMPLFRLLSAQGYNVKQGQRKLLQPFRTTVLPHGGGSLFSKIMDITTLPSDAQC